MHEKGLNLLSTPQKISLYAAERAISFQVWIVFYQAQVHQSTLNFTHMTTNAVEHSTSVVNRSTIIFQLIFQKLIILCYFGKSA